MIAELKTYFKESSPEPVKVIPLLGEDDKKALDLLAKLIAEHIINTSEN